MKWKKLGKIFDPTQHRLANNCHEFAQSPQTLVFDDFVRIYFSTREVDTNGKFLSHISFVDMDKDLTRVRSVAKTQVISLGELGAFDEHGIFPMAVIRRGNSVLGFTGGWSRRVSVSVETSIGLAVSDDDGLSFVRRGPGPVLTSSLNEPMLVGDPFVQLYDDVFHMWYIFGPRWVSPPDGGPPDRVYKIGHAVSKDAVNWQKEEGRQIVSDVLGADECQALPTVIQIDSTYHMWFCFRHATDFRMNPKRAYRIGHASSVDLVNWTRDDASLGLDTTDGDWDSDMLCYPHVYRSDDRIYLLYNGNSFGRFGFGAAVLEP